MAVDVPMPKLGLTMEEATIIEWLVADGTPVENEQPIMLIETDKTETEVGAPGGGRLHQIGRPGQTFACGELVGQILADGENPPTTSPTAPTGTEPAEIRFTSTGGPEADFRRSGSAPEAHTSIATGRLLASPNARRVAAERGVQLRTVRGTGPGGRIVSEDVLAAPLTTGTAPSRAAVATAAARNLADLLGVDLGQVPLDPVERRITREAVALHVRGLLSASQAVSDTRSVSDTELLQEPTETIRLSGMRGTIARRMRASLQE